MVDNRIPVVILGNTVFTCQFYPENPNIMQGKHYALYLTMLMMILCSVSLSGQVNLRVGYNLGYLTPEKHHQILQQFNSDRPWILPGFKNFKTLNGIQLGLRYTLEDMDWLAFEITWHNQYHRQSVTGIDPAPNTEFSRIAGFRYSSLGLGMENFIGQVSWGASINYDQVKHHLEGTNMNKHTVQENFGWSSHFFLGYNVKSGPTMKIGFRPYAHISWHNINLAGLNEALNPLSDSSLPIEENYSAFGLMIVFYNGN